MPSELAVVVAKVSAIYPHDNADRLELLEVLGWQVVAQKGVYKVGEKVVYFPIDSVLPETLEKKLFPEGSKITLNGSRVRTIKIRGTISQGLVAPLDAMDISIDTPEGTDLTNFLGVSKYKQQDNTPAIFKGNQASKKQTSSYFPSYSKINHLHSLVAPFNNEVIVITEKLHGTNARYGWVPKEPKTIWERIKHFFSSQKSQFVYGSHNVQLKPGGNNVYWKMAEKYDLEKICRIVCEGHGWKSFVIYGEIVGDGVQKNYSYGCAKGEQKFVVFDMKVNGEYIDFIRMQGIAELFGLQVVPRVFYGYYTKGIERNINYQISRYAPSQKIMEGVTIRTTGSNRKILKYINPEYLLKDNTEWT